MTVTEKNDQIHKDSPRNLGVMAKYWTPGTVKTRLGASTGDQVSAAIHRIFCLHLARQLGSVADQRYFVVSPPAKRQDFQSELPPTWETCPQSDGDLGRRMGSWFEFQSGSADAIFPRCILIGADCPCLDAAIVQRAFDELTRHDLVLGPALDGGYYLIGFSGEWLPRKQALLENIPWSSEKVFAETVRRAQAADLRFGLLPKMEDVDTIHELDRLRRQLATAPDGSVETHLLHQINDALSQGKPEQSPLSPS